MESKHASCEAEVRKLLSSIYGDAKSKQDNAFIESGMGVVELVRVYELVRSNGCTSALEVGMANGTSSVVICEALRRNGGGTLVSIDPYQSSQAYAGKGLENLRKAKLDHLHRLVEEPDYIALPKLLEHYERFDFVLLDGWHSFDYTMLDCFYTDLLLKDRGIVALHDTSAPPVYQAVHFLETNKPYERLCPPVTVDVRSLRKRIWRRVRLLLTGPAAGAAARARREQWKTLAAYRKLATCQVPQYPHEPLFDRPGSLLKSSSL